jgi:hypothetical protein
MGVGVDEGRHEEIDAEIAGGEMSASIPYCAGGVSGICKKSEGSRLEWKHTRGAGSRERHVEADVPILVDHALSFRPRHSNVAHCVMFLNDLQMGTDRNRWTQI